MQAALKQTTAVLAPDPFSARRKSVSVPPGLTITQVVAHAAANDNLPPRWAMPYLRVYVGGVEVPRDWWPRTRLKDGQHVAIVAAPQGGNGGVGKVFRTLLTVAVIALTAWVGAGGAAGLLSGLFSGVTFGAGTVASALAAAGVSIIGGVLTNALAPSANSNSEAASQSFSLTGARNVAKPYQPMTAVLGKRRVVPPLAAATWTETVDDDVYLRMMVQWHIGPCSLSDIKIGETPISSFEGVEMQHRLLPGDDYPSLYDQIVREEPLQVFLQHSDGWQQRTTQRDTTRISIDFAWPTGLAEATDNNNEAASVKLQVQYRAVGAGAWTNAPVGVGGVLTYTDNKSNPFRRSIAWDVDKGQYEVQIQRVTNDTTAMNVTDQVYWVALRSYGEGRPFLLDTAAITALRIKSSAQLNGVLDTLNAVVQMHAPKWDSEAGAFGGAAPSRNPGEIMNWLALGPANARPLTDRADVAGLGAWAERCTAKGWNCDHIVDNGGTLDQVAQIVAGTGRGFGAMWFDGKLSVAVDDQQDTPVQEFSARNVRNFTGSIAFPGALHAVNVQFQDEENGYQTATRTVFANGYSNDNASLYETIDAPGKVGAAEAWVVGWRYLAGRLLRPEIYEFDTDLEGLVCRIGQRIQVAHYRMSVGICGARVKARVLNDGGDVTGLWLDETVTMVEGKDYVFRAQSGSVINLHDIETTAGTARLISFPAPLDPDAAPRVGDHGIFGEAGKESLAGIVVGLGVKAGKDSHVTAIPYAPDLLADGGDIPAWDPLITPRGTSPTPVGVHAPGLDRVIIDKLVKDINDERGARTEGDATPIGYERLNEELQEDLNTVLALVPKVDAQQRAAAAIRGLQDDVARAATALLQVQLIIPQLSQEFQRQLDASVQAITGSDVTDFAARLFVAESTIIDLQQGKASATDLRAIDSQINTPSTGIAALISNLQETVALLDPFSASAVISQTATAVRGQGLDLDKLGVTVLQILQNLDKLQVGQSATLAYYRREITAQVEQGVSGNAKAVGELGALMQQGQAALQASITSEQQARVTAVSAIASDNETILAAMNGYTAADAVAQAFTSTNAAVSTVSDDLADLGGDLEDLSGTVAAQATTISGVSSQVDRVRADGYVSIATQATPGDALARIALLVSATSGGATSTAALFLDALSGGDSRVIVVGNKFYVTDGTHVESLDSVLEFSGGVLTVPAARITGTLDVGSLIADNAIVGGQIVTGNTCKPFVAAQSGTVTASATVKTEILRRTCTSLGGVIQVLANFAQVSKADSGNYSDCAWELHHFSPGLSIGGGTIASGTYYANDSGELWRTAIGNFTGVYGLGDNFDVVLFITGDGSKRPNIGKSQFQILAFR